MPKPPTPLPTTWSLWVFLAEFPAEVFDGLVTKDMVEKDIVNGITAAFEGNSSYQLNVSPSRKS